MYQLLGHDGDEFCIIDHDTLTIQTVSTEGLWDLIVYEGAQIRGLSREDVAVCRNDIFAFNPCLLSPAFLFHQPFICKVVDHYGSAGSFVLRSTFLIDFGIGIVVRILCLRSLYPDGSAFKIDLAPF